MGGVLKFLLGTLLALIILVIVVPLIWLLIQELGGLFGFYVAGSDIWYFLFCVACVIFIIWMISIIRSN